MTISRRQCGCTPISRPRTCFRRSGDSPNACSVSTSHPAILTHPIAQVEAEKTAVICSAVFPECFWSATGGLSQFNDCLNTLHGRKVEAFPDLGGYDKWVVKIRNYPTLDITASDYLERIATDEIRAMKADLVDRIEEMRAK